MRHPFNALTLAFAMTAAAIAGGCQSQRTFKSPEQAVTALEAAVKDQDKSELHRIFGSKAGQLTSGDPDQDHDDAIVFARRLATKHEIRSDAPDHATLLVGNERWPFAVPLVEKKGVWRFDTDAGLDELTNRRIGRNELRTIAACRTVIDAQILYFNSDPDGLGTKHYAQRLMSTEGKKDGLYWPAPGGVDPSPIGPGLASSATRRDAKGQHIPFNGYLFKMLNRQAASAPGGAMDYAQNGLLTRGWAVIAYPSTYGETGIMTFICGSDGNVYQQDLGEDTVKAVDQIDTFDPGAGWQNCKTAGE